MNRISFIGISLLACALMSYLTGCTADGLGGAAPAPILGAGTAADPVQIPYAKEALKIDGNPADWAAIAFLPEPFMKKPAGSVKMCWNETGLYLLAVVKDKSITTDSVSPWDADCVELFLEKDGAGAADMSENAVQYIFTPTPEMGEGRCPIVIAQGSKANAGKIVAVWKKTADGYVIEIMFPAVAVAPAKLAAGTKLNLNFAIDDDGKAIEQFCNDKSANDGYKTPQDWGKVILKK